jgi:diacylglycerol kinase (ATP)
MKALLIINEKAGGLSAELIEKSIYEELKHYSPRIWEQVELMICQEPAMARQKVDMMQSELDRVIAVGGDGTVIEVISIILPYPHIQLGILPLGTGNRLASNLGIPLHLKGALQTALKGAPYRIDVGRLNGRYFALMAGAGLDAEIMDKVHPLEKKTMGVFAYIWQGFRRAFRTPYAIFEIEADGQFVRTRGIGVIVANAGNLLGRYFTLTPGAKPNDGLFDICILSSRNRADYWTTIIQVLSQQKRGIYNSGVKHLKARKIQIRSRPLVKVQADGDVIGMTPIEIEALPQAVAVLVPHEKRQGSSISASIHHISDHLRLLFRDFFHI